MALGEDRTTRVQTTVGSTELALPDGHSVALPKGFRIVAAPADGDVAFFASGVADNATVVLLGPNDREIRTVVHQRGRIR